MITRCNRCGAKFEISADLVRSQDPTVRCGECLSVFDASAHLVTDDSIHNYVTEPATGRRRRNRKAAESAAITGPATARAATVSQTTNPVSAESMAQLSAEDLENASTLALDRSTDNSEAPGIAPHQRPAPDRVNDGFYSPDLDINQYGSSSSGSASTGARMDTAIDPENRRRDSMQDPLDNTSLEFERTLALENFPEETSDVSPSQGQHSSGFRQSSTDQYIAEPRTNATYDETVQLEQTDDYSPENYHPAHQYNTEPVTGTGAERSTSEYTGTSINAGRDYPLLSEDILDRDSTELESDNALTGSIQTQPDSMYADDHSLDVRESGVGAADDEDDYRSEISDQNSARELRRYVSSRGGTVYSNHSRARQQQSTSRSSLMPILLVCVALAAVLYFARDVIAKMNLPEPVVSVFCGVTGCELPAKKDVEQLELVRHQMFSHKTLDDVLVFSVDLVNRAKFPQPYPVLVVTMANGTGESVAFRKFEPAEYLEDDPLLKTLPAGEPVRIKFEIVDPGPEALSSELSFE